MVFSWFIVYKACLNLLSLYKQYSLVPIILKLCLFHHLM